jgi:hypothetical protein
VNGRTVLSSEPEVAAAALAASPEDEDFLLVHVEEVRTKYITYAIAKIDHVYVRPSVSIFSFVP